jgi:hypothetical protein
MAFLRIAVFDIEDAPGDALEIWDDLVGSALRNHPECLQVMVSHRGTNYAVVSKWSSEDAFRQAMEAKPMQDVVRTVSARLGVADQPEPMLHFEGDIEDEV